MHRRGAGAAGAALAAAGVLSAVLTLPAAAGTYTPPAGCEGWLTVQMRSCKVSNHYRCAGDAPGDQWRIDFGLNGPFFRSRIDAETQWVESHNSDGTVQLLAPDAPDPASFSELLETGRDSYDFTTLRTTGETERMRGADELTGETAVIDGVTLLRTRYEIRATQGDGRLSWQARGGEYVHPDWRIFLSGRGEMDLGEGWLPRDFTPVEFIFPGEEEFFTTIPRYDCEAVMAGRAVPVPVVPAALHGETDQ